MAQIEFAKKPKKFEAVMYAQFENICLKDIGLPTLDLKNGGRGTKPTYIFLVIIPLLVIELKATPNGNPSDDCYWRQKSRSLNVAQYNTTVGLLLFTYKSI